MSNAKLAIVTKLLCAGDYPRFCRPVRKERATPTGQPTRLSINFCFAVSPSQSDEWRQGATAPRPFCRPIKKDAAHANCFASEVA